MEQQRDQSQNIPPRRSGRQTRPPTTYTPSRPTNTINKNYSVNRQKLADKAKTACERNEIMVGVNKRGNLVITFKAGAYKYYHRKLDQLYEESQEQNATIQLNMERQNREDSTGIKTDTTYKIKNPHGEGCVINCYHTTFRALVNGSVTYYRNEINPLIVQRMNINEISQQNIETMNEISNIQQRHPATQNELTSQQDHPTRQQEPQTNQQGQPVSQIGQQAPTRHDQGQPTNQNTPSISQQRQPRAEHGHTPGQQQQNTTMTHQSGLSTRNQEVPIRQTISQQDQSPTRQYSQTPPSQQGQPTRQLQRQSIMNRRSQPMATQQIPHMEPEETCLKQIPQPHSADITCLDELIDMETLRASPMTEKEDICTVEGNLGQSRDCLASSKTVNLPTDADNEPSPPIDPEETCLKQSSNTRSKYRKLERHPTLNGLSPKQNRNGKSELYPGQQPLEQETVIDQEETNLKQISQPHNADTTCLDELTDTDTLRTSPMQEKEDIGTIRGNLGRNRDCLAPPKTVNLSIDADIEPSQEILCPICEHPTLDEAIECDQCERFIHFYCENIDEKILEAANKNNEYICSSCFLKNTEEEEERTTPKNAGTQPNVNRGTNTNKSSTRTENKTLTKKPSSGQQGISQLPITRPQSTEIQETPTIAQPKKRNTTKGNNNYPRRSNNAIKHDCIDTERKIALLQEEVARLEDIIVEQKNTIRIHKMRAAAACSNNLDQADASPYQAPNSIQDRLRSMEFENLRTRITVLELEAKLNQQTAVQCQRNQPKQQHNNPSHSENSLAMNTLAQTRTPGPLDAPYYETLNRGHQERTSTEQTKLMHSWDSPVSAPSTQSRSAETSVLLPRTCEKTETVQHRRQHQWTPPIRARQEHRCDSLASYSAAKPIELILRKRQIPDSVHQEVHQKRQGTLHEQARPGHSWDSLAMPLTAQPGMAGSSMPVTKIYGATETTQQRRQHRWQSTEHPIWEHRYGSTETHMATQPIEAILRAPEATDMVPQEDHHRRQQGIPPEQARPGHSQDSLAMPSTAQPGTVGPLKEETIDISPKAAQFWSRHQRTMHEQARPGLSWDSLARPPTAQPGTPGPVEDNTTDTAPQEVHQKRQQGIPPEQARPGHSQDSLAMPSTAQPGTVGPLEEETKIEGKQPNEGIILQEYPGEERSDKSKQSGTRLDGDNHTIRELVLLEHTHTKKDDTKKPTDAEIPSGRNFTYAGTKTSKDGETSNLGRPDPEPHSPKPQDQTESSISRDCLATTFMTQPYSSTTEEQMQQGIGNTVDIRAGEPSILKYQTCGHRFKDNNKTVIPAIEENNTRSPNHHHFLSKGRANTEVSHRRLQNIQTIIPYRIPQQTQKIPLLMYKNPPHPYMDLTTFYQGRPLFQMWKVNQTMPRTLN